MKHARMTQCNAGWLVEFHTMGVRYGAELFNAFADAKEFACEVSDRAAYENNVSEADAVLSKNLLTNHEIANHAKAIAKHLTEIWPPRRFEAVADAIRSREAAK